MKRSLLVIAGVILACWSIGLFLRGFIHHDGVVYADNAHAELKSEMHWR
jgi:hypothetical protein